jgi:hypothetical protein
VAAAITAVGFFYQTEAARTFAAFILAGEGRKLETASLSYLPQTH